MKRLWTLMLPLACLLAACGEEDERFASIVTNFADCPVDAQGAIREIRLDNGDTYTLTHPVSTDTASVVLRALCGYELAPDGHATLYNATLASVLHDSTSVAKADPTAITSMWRAGRYINTILSPLSYDRRHYWGFAVDSMKGNRHYLSLHHNQNGDATSFTTTVYASLPIQEIPDWHEGDQVTVFVHTFDGEKRWDFN